MWLFNMLFGLGSRLRPASSRGRLHGKNQSASRPCCALLVFVTVGGLAACGFQLRGEYVIPYTSLYVAYGGASSIGLGLKRTLSTLTHVLPTAAGAEAQLNILSEQRDKQILSLSGAGRVREYQLKLQVSYQLVDAKGNVIIPTSDIQLSRIMSYDDALVVTKQLEETMLYQDMDKDAQGQILRRMTAIRQAS